jgi:hypothetical protein
LQTSSWLARALTALGDDDGAAEGCRVSPRRDRALRADVVGRTPGSILAAARLTDLLDPSDGRDVRRQTSPRADAGHLGRSR